MNTFLDILLPVTLIGISIVGVIHDPSTDETLSTYKEKLKVKLVFLPFKLTFLFILFISIDQLLKLF